jgi:O-methyltransferase involved in polyketide biosynthesis
VSQLDYDFTEFEKARLSQLGVSIRTMLLDRAVTAFIHHNPSGIVVNLGAGLDTRWIRLGTVDTVWYELDLPETIELRNRFFSESDTYRFIAKSMFDFSWLDEINDADRPVLLVAEGLFMYFEEQQLRELMEKLIGRFPGAEMLVEVMGPAIVGKSRSHDSLSKIADAPEFKWGTRHSKALESWHPKLEVLDEWCYFDYYKKRAGLIGCIVRLPFIRPRINPRIVKLGFYQ